MTRLIAVAGRSRSGKGTVARVIAEECAVLGLTCLERQLSDNGKWSLARIFRPTIGRVEAVQMWESLKSRDVRVVIEDYEHGAVKQVPLQKFLQHGLQEGGRDIFGEHYWTDRIIPSHWDGKARWWWSEPWLEGFFDAESGSHPTDVAVISDLRQPNEAQRVRDVGGVVVECVRPESYDAYVTGADHITERGLPDDLVGYRIINDGSLVDLELKARTIIVGYLHRWGLDKEPA